jgi:hypothetical protein
MRSDDWREEERDRLRRLRDRDRDDYGQADYSDTYGYDPRTRAGYRAYDDGRGDYIPPERREWDRAPPARARRDGPSDRVLWAIVTERLDHEHRLDLRDVEVIVEDAEVTLNGTVRHKGDKRRIEDVADIEGVRHIQNNLRVRERSRWTLF